MLGPQRLTQLAQNVLEHALELDCVAAQVADEFADDARDGFFAGELLHDFGVALAHDVFEGLAVDFADAVLNYFLHG